VTVAALDRGYPLPASLPVAVFPEPVVGHIAKNAMYAPPTESKTRAAVGARRQVVKVILAVIAMWLRHAGMLTLSSFADADIKNQMSAPPAAISR
jgi:hypothetical protein